jgi:hypothetical protein
MNRRLWGVVAAICVLAMSAVCTAQTSAQAPEVKEKPPIYTYVGFWSIPRAQWAEMDKAAMADRAILEKAIAAGTIVGFGNDVNLVHQPEGMTHDDWWSSTSMAGMLNVLDQFYKSGNSVTPVLTSATKHADAIFVSRYYNWHPGSWKDIYTHGSSYKLKANAPEDAVETLAKNLVVPMLEKMLASGAIHEYEIDTEAIHTESPRTFWIFYLAANAEGLDKVNAAIQSTLKANPLGGSAFDSMVDFSEHRDYLARTNATYK